MHHLKSVTPTSAMPLVNSVKYSEVVCFTKDGDCICHLYTLFCAVDKEGDEQFSTKVINKKET